MELRGKKSKKNDDYGIDHRKKCGLQNLGVVSGRSKILSITQGVIQPKELHDTWYAIIGTKTSYIRKLQRVHTAERPRVSIVLVALSGPWKGEPFFGLETKKGEKSDDYGQ